MFEAKKPDERTGRVAWRTVLETYERIAPGVLHLTVEAANDNEVNGSTASDPNNTSLTLRSIERDDAFTRVYNFAVQSLSGEVTHNYLVGEKGCYELRNAVSGNTPHPASNLRQALAAKG